MNAQKEALKTGRLDQALAALAGHIEAPEVDNDQAQRECITLDRTLRPDRRRLITSLKLLLPRCPMVSSCPSDRITTTQDLTIPRWVSQTF
jgi:hypothetical protein